jgi:hypothetical protein
MSTPNDLPIPSGDVGSRLSGLIDPKTGNPVPVADMRAEFERLSRQIPRDLEAERAFIESKIEMIRNDPHLSEEEKERAIKALQGGVK